MYQDLEPSTQLAEEIFGDVDTAKTIIKDLKELSHKGFDVKVLGERKLKGLENPEFIYLMYPQSLAGRLQAKSAQKAVAQPRLGVNPDDIWKLWDISLRLEMLCSLLNTADNPPLLKMHTLDITSKLRDSTGEGSDQVMMQLFEHVVTRIENCMNVLYLRRLLAPDPMHSTLMETATPLVGLIDLLAAQLGVKITGAGAGAADHDDSATRFIEDISSASSTASSSSSSSTAVSPTTATPLNSSRQSYTLNLPSSRSLHGGSGAG